MLIVDMPMARAGLQILRERRRWKPIRILHWLPVLALTVILVNLQSPTSSAQNVCPNGTYIENQPDSSTPKLDTTTNSWTETTVALVCRNCSDRIEHCEFCESLSNNTVICKGCKSGYELKDNNCTASTKPPDPTSDKTTKIIIAVVVSIVGALVVAAVIVGIIFGVRRGTFKNLNCSVARSSPTPPPMPHPEDLGVSFKNEQDSGTGQRVDMRYTEEPGGPVRTNRVESAHYNDFNGPNTDDDVYMNALGRSNNTPATLQEEIEDVYENTDNQNDDEVYVNTDFSGPSSISTAKANLIHSTEKPRTTKAASGPVNSKAPRPMTKPKTFEKPTMKSKTQSAPPDNNRGSIFPPDDPPGEIYSNEPEEPDDDDEDYVNSEEYQAGKR